MSSDFNTDYLTREDFSEAFRQELARLEIPHNIDPRLFALWLERENKSFEQKQHEHEIAPRQATRPGVSLVPLFGAFLGITVMIVTILLGLVQANEPNDILFLACKTFLGYTLLGCVAGWIAERCVRDSVETMLREIGRRTSVTEEQQAPSVSAGE